MRGIWSYFLPPPGFGDPTLGTPTTWVYRIRSARVYLAASAALRLHVVPFLTGVGTLVCAVALVNRLAFETASRLDRLCPPASHATAVTVNSADFCTPTGIYVEAQARYRIRLSRADGDTWSDASIAAPFPEGYSTWSLFARGNLAAPFIAASLPFRRVVFSGRWFTVFATVRGHAFEAYPLERADTEITPKVSGELLLFVNDSILPIGVMPPALGWDAYYANNHGAANVVIERR
jgi:hypothetical protein